ncbi:MAG TPA: HU family DNA-binding protein [bacterium]|nr:HU family DNA-binding protein [Patescibacteria group bacterium]HPO11453.1 HU family DNA-binding protein [bacterium]
MNKAQLCEIISEKFKMPKKQAEDIIETIFDTFISELKNNNKVSIVGFGSFVAKTRHARRGVDPRNPSTIINVPETRVTKFKAGKKLKDVLNGR